MNEYSRRQREREVETWVRAAADSLEVSRDLRPRVLDRLQDRQREERAGHGVFLACLALAALATIPDQLGTVGVQPATISTAAVDWADMLSTFPDSASDRDGHVLTWSGPVMPDRRGAHRDASDGSSRRSWQALRARIERRIFLAPGSRS